MRLSTTTLTSARFTYVSPAGTVERKDREELDEKGKSHNWIRLVDGGYFENSGSIAITEILNQIDKNKDLRDKIKPIVIHISNEPGYPERELKKTGSHTQATLMGEILSPLSTLLAVRGGKGQQARLALEYMVSKPEQYIHFKLMKPANLKLPLGWMLSEEAQKNMDGQLLSQFAKVDEINRFLNGIE